MALLNKMVSPIKTILLFLCVTIGTIITPASADDFAEREQLARKLIIEVWEISHVTDLYRDMRRSVEDAYIPALELFSKHKWPEPLADQQLAAMADLLKDGLPVSDEATAFIAANREELIADGAQYIAKYATLEQLKVASDAVRLNVTKKTIDATYNYFRIYTDYKRVDAQNIHDIVMYFVPRADSIADRNKDLFNNGLIPNKVPPQARVAKAQVIINDAVRISRIDEMSNNVINFAQNVVLPNIPPEQQDMFKTYLGWGVLKYNFGKNFLVGAAPSAVALFLEDEELEHVGAFVNNSTFSDFWAKQYTTIEIFTSITPQDVTDARVFGEALIKNTGIKKELSEAEANQAKADFEALGEKWRKKVEAAISPKAREKLERSIEKVKALEEQAKTVRDSNEL